MLELAGLMTSRWEYDEAQELYGEARNRNFAALDALHEIAVRSTYGLLDVLFYQKMYKEAEVMSQKALEECTRQLGIKNEHTFRLMNRQAVYLNCQLRYAEVEMILKKTLGL